MQLSTQLAGIVNVTPDSFSDGGAAFEAADAIAAIERMIIDGANIIDIGAESTRPGATELNHTEEWRRLEPVLAQLERFAAAPVGFSIDSRHPATVRKALGFGIDIINDVSGFSDPIMVDAVAGSNASLILMHSLGIPADKNTLMPQDRDVIEMLLEFAHARIGALEKAGIERSRILFDPGIGFGKTPQQSMTIIRDVKKLYALGVPIMIGHSRKSFLGLKPDATTQQRDDATLAVSKYLLTQHIGFLRVHNIPRHRALINAMEAA